MERRFTRHTVNQVSEIQNENLNLLTPDTDVTKMPYQGHTTNYEYYSRVQNSCFDLDKALDEIVSKKFTGNNLRNMTDEDAIEAYKALEQAKANRTKAFLDLAKLMSDDMFFRKQQEIERLKNSLSEGVIEADVIDNTKTSKEKEVNPLERERQQKILRLLQEAVVEKRKSNTDE